MPANNPFPQSGNSPLASAISMANITPSDASDLPTLVRQIYVGVGGDVNVIDSKGNAVLHKNVGSGCYLGPFAVARVLATGTTATNLIGYV